MSIEDQLASTCHNFVSILRVRNEYFLIDERNKGVKVGQAVHDNAAIRYSAHWNFIKKYSALFELGEVFQWNNSVNFYNWLRSILIANPRFIEPHLRSLNALFTPRNADVNLVRKEVIGNEIDHLINFPSDNIGDAQKNQRLPKARQTTRKSNFQRHAIPIEPNRLPNVPQCRFCLAKRFPNESDNFCCSKGKIKLYSINIPDNLLQLYNGQSKKSKDFLHDIRAYNNNFAFTSLRVNLDPKYATNNKGIYTFRAQGQVCHYINSLYPTNRIPSFLQLYFHDTDKEIENRMNFTKTLDKENVTKLVKILDENPYSKFFRSLHVIPNLENHEIRIRANPILDVGTMSAPSASQVAAIWCESEERSDFKERDILVHTHDGHSQRIRYYYGCYDPLQYPLLFPLGEPGWHQGIKKVSEKQLGAFSHGQGSVLPSHSTTSEDLITTESLVYEENLAKDNMVSAREFYAYRFQIRPSIDSIILQSGRLLQQFAVDMYVKIETSRLDYFRNKQDEIRADLYQGIIDSISKDDLSNEKCLEEASFYCMPLSLRQLFCTILVHCNAMNPKQLFLKFEDSLKEDFTKRELMSNNEARQCLLQALKSELESMGRKLTDFGLHDLIDTSTETSIVCKEIQDEKNIKISEKDLQNSANLNKEQIKAFNDILEAVTFEKPMSFFIDGQGGTGKTFLYRSLLAVVRSRNLIALATATSGVAASILPNGRTAHSRFKIPIDGEGKLSCNVSKQSGLASLLKSASLIIWDEASMAKRQSIEALDILLRDLTEKDYLFGGKVVVLGGDFRQVLPVIPKGSKDDCIDASLVRSPIWSSLKKHTLKENMRAKQDPAFSNFLLRIGNGVEPQNSKGEISIPSSMIIQPVPEKTPVQQLMDFAFPDLSRYSTDAISMTNSAILSPRNDTVDEINEELIARFPGEQHEYLSIDQTVNKANQGLYIDFMHSVAPPGLPPHRLILIENCPVILLRNINPSKGLCNGTRLICRNFEKHTIIAEIAVGEKKNRHRFHTSYNCNFILIGTTTNLATGIKLQTRGSTTFIFDPILPEANALKTW
ncbi:hypothetical protein RHMOL_Rhmol11G0040100 [Rhododendron molle]|nr:hypothetical protein RHMOL_Rhmol11G0040100 [Rhododendron molle]